MNTALNFCFFCFKTKERLKQKATKIIGTTSLVDRASSQTIKANKLHCSIKKPVEPFLFITEFTILLMAIIQYLLRSRRRVLIE
jgi:hypothetical protein